MIFNSVFRNIFEQVELELHPIKMTQVINRHSLAIFRTGGIERDQQDMMLNTMGRMFVKTFKARPVVRKSIAFDEERAEWNIPIPKDQRLLAEGNTLNIELIRGINFVELLLAVK